MLLFAYANATPSMPEEAKRVLKRMLAAGVKADTLTYNTLVTACARASPCMPKDSERVLTRMQAAGVKPDRRTYETVIEAYATASPRLPEDAERMLGRMKVRAPHVPMSMRACLAGHCRRRSRTHMQLCPHVYKRLVCWGGLCCVAL